jgi:hypothetical protein
VIPGAGASDLERWPFKRQWKPREPLDVACLPPWRSGRDNHPCVACCTRKLVLPTWRPKAQPHGSWTTVDLFLPSRATLMFCFRQFGAVHTRTHTYPKTHQSGIDDMHVRVDSILSKLCHGMMSFDVHRHTDDGHSGVRPLPSCLRVGSNSCRTRGAHIDIENPSRRQLCSEAKEPQSDVCLVLDLQLMQDEHARHADLLVPSLARFRFRCQKITSSHHHLDCRSSLKFLRVTAELGII